jgi:hypothetical protein
MTRVVGQTPVVQLRKVVPDGAADVFVELEPGHHDVTGAV